MTRLLSIYWFGLTLLVTCYSFPILYDVRSLQPTMYARRPTQKDKKPPLLNFQGGLSVPSVDGFIQVLGLDKLFGGFGNFIGGLTGGGSSFNDVRRPTRIRPSIDDRFEEEEIDEDDDLIHEQPVSKRKDKTEQPIINLIFVTKNDPKQRHPQKQSRPSGQNVQVIRLPNRRQSNGQPIRTYTTQQGYRTTIQQPEHQYPIYYYYHYNPYDYYYYPLHAYNTGMLYYPQVYK